MQNILVVEDEYIEARNLERMLVKNRYKITGIARSVPIALALIDKVLPDFVLLEIFLRRELTGIDFARILIERDIPFIYLSANSDKATFEAAKATRPFGFLVKPFREKDVLAMIEIAIYRKEHGLESLTRRQEVEKAQGTFTPEIENKTPDIIGKSKPLKDILKLVHIVAPSETSVLIMGESGTGKERIAQAIHELSPRKEGPFIKINCSALPVTLIESILFGHEKGPLTNAIGQSTGKFEQAEKGTLFLDEIGEIPKEIQVKLLRALQEKEFERIGGNETIKVDVRIVTATNRDLVKEMSEGRFRRDLYYRLNVFPIELPPLRERKEDILPLATHFISMYCKKEKKKYFHLSEQLINSLVTHSWPGNVRELENEIKRMVLIGMESYLEGFFYAVSDSEKETAKFHLSTSTDIKSWEEYERDYLLYVLKRCKGKISGENSAAKFLRLPPSTLESKMKRLGIKKADYTGS